MRTKKSIQNIIISVILGLGVVIVNFVTQKFFINTLGLEYLGLNGLFTNIVSMLAVTELGLGSAIVYHLYKPLHEHDMNMISSVMQFYKIGYRYTAIAIVILGVLFLPFMSLVIGQNNVTANVYVIFSLFIANAVASYLLSYKRSILYADQKSYVINTAHLGALIVLNALQILVLIETQNYYLFLGLKIIFTILENIILNQVVDKQYSLMRSPAPIPQELRKDIFIKIRGLAYHNVGSFVIGGSTNILISILLGLTTVGLYSNYLLIQTAISVLFVQLGGAIKASVGNLLVSESKATSFTIFLRLNFAGNVLAVLSASIFLVSSGGFVSLWVGDRFVLTAGVTAALTINIYLYLVRWVAFHNFKEAAGIFYEDRFVPLVEAAINILASIALIHFMGLSGAFLGTALSSLTLHAYTYPKFVYKGILGRGYREYVTKTVGSFLAAFVSIGLAYLASTYIYTDSKYLKLIADLCVSVSVPCLILWLIYSRTDEYLYFIKLFRNNIKK